jgi:hypothetical protein
MTQPNPHDVIRTKRITQFDTIASSELDGAYSLENLDRTLAETLGLGDQDANPLGGH